MAKNTKTSSSGRSGRGPQGSNLDEVPTSALTAELARRERRLKALAAKRERLAHQIRELDEQLGALDSQLGLPPGRKRPTNETNLADSMEAVLDGYEMSVTELAEGVKKAGYHTTSPNFRTIVNQTLIKDERFTRISRGIYGLA